MDKNGDIYEYTISDAIKEINKIYDELEELEVSLDKTSFFEKIYFFVTGKDEIILIEIEKQRVMLQSVSSKIIGIVVSS